MNDVRAKEDVAGNLWFTYKDALGLARQHKIPVSPILADQPVGGLTR